ncbi:hypothetical protein CGCF413_v002959 [Colletotrichum fructicola]|nr:hypothetical protein CGCF413_v002959 [Colletotrichum fructicola]
MVVCVGVPRLLQQAPSHPIRTCRGPAAPSAHLLEAPKQTSLEIVTFASNLPIAVAYCAAFATHSPHDSSLPYFDHLGPIFLSQR